MKIIYDSNTHLNCADGKSNPLAKKGQNIHARLSIRISNTDNVILKDSVH